MSEVLIFENAEQISKQIAQTVIQLSKEEIEKKNSFTIAFSGGSLPKIFSSEITKESISCQIDFTKWLVFFVDERNVSLENPESNYHACKEHLFSKVNIPENQIFPAINPNLSLTENSDNYQKLIQEKIENQTFDAVFLGMGPDGHTASLFPNHNLLNEKERIIEKIENSPKPPPERITFTFPLINKAKNVFFVVTGSEKSEVLKKIHSNENKSDFPASMVNPANNGKLLWFLDSNSASQLDSNLGSRL